jgi:hypothetical protein
MLMKNMLSLPVNETVETYIPCPAGYPEEMITWLHEYSGHGYYCLGTFGIYFSHPTDAAWFKLKWS